MLPLAATQKWIKPYTHGRIMLISVAICKVLKSSCRNQKKTATQPNCNQKQPDFYLQLSILGSLVGPVGSQLQPVVTGNLEKCHFSPFLVDFLIF
jgi:hypothetical protein